MAQFYEVRSHSTTDASYSDPIGELPQRPKTAARVRDEEEWNEDVGDDLLPE